MSELVIETTDLTRHFGDRPAVQGLNLRVRRGRVSALLGRNGSGKTTTIRLLLGLLAPTRGQARVLGHDALALSPAVRARIGYMPEGHPVYGWMRAVEFGDYQARHFPTWKHAVFERVLEFFEIDPGARARHLSRGQRAGLSLAITLAPEPELLVLDDPALGLDRVAQKALLEAMIHVTEKRERTILFTSHLLGDVERVADDLAVLDGAVLRAACPVETFRERVRELVLVFPGGPPTASPGVPGLLEATVEDDELRLIVANPGEASSAAVRALGAASVEERELGLEAALTAFLGRRRARPSLLAQLGEADRRPEPGKEEA